MVEVLIEVVPTVIGMVVEAVARGIITRNS